MGGPRNGDHGGPHNEEKATVCATVGEQRIHERHNDTSYSPHDMGPGNGYEEESKLSSRSILWEMWEMTSQVPYVRNLEESTCKEFTNKCRLLERAHRDKKHEPNHEVKELRQMLNELHRVSSANRRAKMARIQEIVSYGNQEKRQNSK